MEAIISKRFNEKILFDNFHLSIPDSGITLLQGESGCGKTTLLRILSGLENSDGGNQNDFLKRKCAYVFQEPRLIEHFSAKNNLFLVNKNYVRVHKLLEEAGLDPNNEIPVSKYSGGEKARVSILRALLDDSDFLLFDEPFNGLDEKNKEIMSKIIKREIGIKPAVLVTHAREDFQNFVIKHVISL